jgi:hypothetical protein
LNNSFTGEVYLKAEFGLRRTSFLIEQLNLELNTSKYQSEWIRFFGRVKMQSGELIKEIFLVVHLGVLAFCGTMTLLSQAMLG